MEKVLRGKDVGFSIREQIKVDVEELKKLDKYPKLAIVRLGANPDDIYYENSIIKNCNDLGIGSEVFEKDLSINTEDLVETLMELNNNDSISGILVFRPLPKHIDDKIISNSVSPDKDVDCMHSLNLGKIFEGDMSGFAPCTPKGAMEILKYYNIPMEGKKAVIINRSTVVGKPLAMMLLEENATVTICHSRTKDLEKITKDADIVLTALGRANMFNEEYFHEKSVLIDIGMSPNEEGKICGDIDYDNVLNKVGAITPVPGGVGSVTTSILLKQVVDACK